MVSEVPSKHSHDPIYSMIHKRNPVRLLFTLMLNPCRKGFYATNYLYIYSESMEPYQRSMCGWVLYHQWAGLRWKPCFWYIGLQFKYKGLGSAASPRFKLQGRKFLHNFSSIAFIEKMLTPSSGQTRSLLHGLIQHTVKQGALCRSGCM